MNRWTWRNGQLTKFKIIYMVAGLMGDTSKQVINKKDVEILSS